jgi:hypothetical protein
MGRTAENAMEQRLIPEAVMEQAGARWRVQRPLGSDVALLRADDGQVVSAYPARVTFPSAPALPSQAARAVNEFHWTQTDWAATALHPDPLLKLAGQAGRGQRHRGGWSSTSDSDVVRRVGDGASWSARNR